MRMLFVVRLIDPVILNIPCGIIVLWHAFHYPLEKKKVYNNIPLKLVLLAFADFSFSLSMLCVGLIFILGHVPNQWWIYYLGALLSGILEAISLSLPVRRRVQV